MGKQFGLDISKEGKIKICQYLLEEGYKFSYGVATKTNELLEESTSIPLMRMEFKDGKLISSESNPKMEALGYKHTWRYFELSNINEIIELLEKDEREDKNRFFGTTFSIYKEPLSEIEFYSVDLSSNKNYNSCPMIEFSGFRFWISSEAKGMSIWNDFDKIKRWMQKNFKYKDKEFVSN